MNTKHESLARKIRESERKRKLWKQSNLKKCTKKEEKKTTENIKCIKKYIHGTENNKNKPVRDAEHFTFSAQKKQEVNVK